VGGAFSFVFDSSYRVRILAAGCRHSSALLCQSLPGGHLVCEQVCSSPRTASRAAGGLTRLQGATQPVTVHRRRSVACTRCAPGAAARARRQPSPRTLRGRAREGRRATEPRSSSERRAPSAAKRQRSRAPRLSRALLCVTSPFCKAVVMVRRRARQRGAWPACLFACRWRLLAPPPPRSSSSLPSSLSDPHSQSYAAENQKKADKYFADLKSFQEDHELNGGPNNFGASRPACAVTCVC